MSGINIKDNGEQTKFSTGAVRDIGTGKGRCDLLPLDILSELSEDKFLSCIEEFKRDKKREHLYVAIRLFSDKYLNDIYTSILEVAKLYEEGASKYGVNNWQKGIPISSFISSGVRHYLKVLRKDNDERHDLAVIWNLFGCAWTLKNKPEMDDLA